MDLWINTYGPRGLSDTSEIKCRLQTLREGANVYQRFLDAMVAKLEEEVSKTIVLP